MPKRTDIKKILIIGAGPIVIGQACEFDYSGVQACKALGEEGYEVVLLNSNPATIMTDPEFAKRTYVEPITLAVLEAIIRRERPDAILPTLGGQTALNLATEAHDHGLLEKYGVEMIGATAEVIHRAEDRDAFKDTVSAAGVAVLRSELAHDMDQARAILAELGLPIVIRASFTLGGTGGSVAYNVEEFEAQAAEGLEISPVHSILLEESVIGWKEFELEVMRDRKDNAVIVCSIENFDPMGVHTGDSITVAPTQTLTDREYQAMRDDALTIIRAIGVETGGCNIQFAVQPQTGRMVAIEMNPRVSRSSALASKATGFPIAKIAAKVAVGMTLDEIPNDITRRTPACFEPTIDYCVVKVPRFTFEKFPGADETLTVSMKSVGEVMAIGRTFKQALQKALRGLEIKRAGLGADGRDVPAGKIDENTLKQKLLTPNAERIFHIRLALQRGMSIEEIRELTGIDPWFLDNIAQIVSAEAELARRGTGVSPVIRTNMAETAMPRLTDADLLGAKKMGFSDAQLAYLFETDERSVRRRRKAAGISAVYKLVDTCGGEFEAFTPYYYSTYEREDESRGGEGRSVIILGGGPNRIGQGIEFDYCCVHAAMAVREEGLEAVMVNCNPETVSTDYDTSDRLYFEPMTTEDVLNVVEAEKPRGVILQFGGQTPLNLAADLEAAGVPILGTSCRSIDLAEDRKMFKGLLERLGLKQAPNETATSCDQALALAERIGYPVLVRPSYVLGGRAMEIVYDAGDLEHFMTEAVEASPQRPVLVDKFLEDAVEVDVDAISDGEVTIIGAVMEHIEAAGVHSGDSACVLPPQTLSPQIRDEIVRQTKALARALEVVGLMNIQYAVRSGEIFVLEVNPRASRTIPFVSKATGVPLAKLATKAMLGRSLESLGLTKEIVIGHVAVKEAVFPFTRFPGIDTQLSPEMKSTGEVMGIAEDFGMAYAKSQLAAGQDLPGEGLVFWSLRDADKTPAAAAAAATLAGLGFALCATEGTAAFLRGSGLECRRVNKVREGRPHIVDEIINGRVALVINTPSGKHPRKDEIAIRSTSWAHRTPLVTTIQGAAATAEAIKRLKQTKMTVRTIQEYTADTHGKPSK